MKLRQLIKSSEFVAMVGLPVLGWILGGVNLEWVFIISGAYVVLNLLGYANKALWEARDEIKKK